MKAEFNNASEAVKRRNPHLFGSQVMGKTFEPFESGKRVRQSSKPLLNKLEMEWLCVMERKWPGFTIWKQAVRWKLSNGGWYKPDFAAFVDNDTFPRKLTCFEVKGPHAFRGGFENLKVAAGLYPEVRWILVWKEKDGQWKQQEILP